MYRVTLTADQVAELDRLCHDKATKPKTRTRMEMVRLSHAGWTIPQIARHFGLTQSRVRHWVKAFLAGGFPGLESKRSPGPPVKLTAAVLSSLKQEIEGGLERGAEQGQNQKTWTAPQIQQWLLDHHGLSVNRTWLSEVLSKNGLSYKRATRHVRHKQNAERVQERKVDLATLKRGPRPG